MLTLVLGGIRSGKSAYAERLINGPAVYIATMLPGDDEIRERIAKHQARRPSHWDTLEATSGIAERVASNWPVTTPALLDGLGPAVAKALDAVVPEAVIRKETEAIIADSRMRDWVVVSEEVGLAPVAPTPAGRQFQDLLGLANQLLSEAAERAVLVVAGRPLELPHA